MKEKLILVPFEQLRVDDYVRFKVPMCRPHWSGRDHRYWRGQVLELHGPALKVCSSGHNEPIAVGKSQVVRAWGHRPHPVCDHCGKPASCLGAYEGQTEERYACDECCGHGNEDGHCVPIQALT